VEDRKAATHRRGWLQTLWSSSQYAPNLDRRSGKSCFVNAEVFIEFGVPFGHFPFRVCRPAQASTLVVLGQAKSNVAVEGIIASSPAMINIP
jgi:hypothetical protein